MSIAIRHWPLLCWVVVLSVLAVIGIYHLPDPEDRRLFADQATHIMAAQSIWHDFDLKYTLEDLARFRAVLPGEPGPKGAFLKLDNNDQLYFAKPFLYALFSSPFVGFLGLNGFMVFNTLCLGIIGIIAIKAFEKNFSQRISFLLVVGFLLFSPFLAWTPIAHPDLFIASLLALGGFLLIYSHNSLNEDKKLVFQLLGALIIGLSIYEKPTFIFIAFFLVLSLIEQIKLRVIFYIVLVIFAGWAIPSTINWIQDGNILAYKGLRFYIRSTDTFPLEPGWNQDSLRLASTDAVFNVRMLPQTLFDNLPLLPSKLIDFLIGRQTGILLYFPVALFLLAYLILHPAWRSLSLVIGLIVYLVIYWLAFPSNGYGGSHSYGPRYTMQGLVALLLALMALKKNQATQPCSSGRGWLLAAAGALGLAVIMQHPVLPPTVRSVNMPADFLLSPLARYFPLEAPLLPNIALVMPSDFSETARGMSFIFRIDGQPTDCFASNISQVGESEVVLYQVGKPYSFPLLRVDINQKAQIELLVGDRSLATMNAKPGLIAPIQLNDFFKENYHDRFLGDIRWQRVTIRARLDPSEPPNKPALMRLGFLETVTANDCPDQGLHGPILWGHAPFNQPDLPDFFDEMIGLYDHESWGRWSIGDQVIFRFNRLLPEHFMLVVVVHALGPNIGAPIKVTAGAAQATFTAQAYPQTHALTFKLTEPTDTLVFTVPEPVRPVDLGFGADARRLGLGFGSLKIFHTDY